MLLLISIVAVPLLIYLVGFTIVFWKAFTYPDRKFGQHDWTSSLLCGLLWPILLLPDPLKRKRKP